MDFCRSRLHFDVSFDLAGEHLSHSDLHTFARDESEAVPRCGHLYSDNSAAGWQLLRDIRIRVARSNDATQLWGWFTTYGEGGSLPMWGAWDPGRLHAAAASALLTALCRFKFIRSLWPLHWPPCCCFWRWPR